MSELSLKERQHQVREDMILDIAHRLLSEQGYDGLNMDDLAHQVGIAKATLYQHFPSKADVMVGVMLRMIAQTEALVFDKANADRPPLDRLAIGLRIGLGSRIHSRRWKVNPNMDVVKNNPRFLEHYHGMIEKLADLIAQAQQQGTVNPALSTPVAANVIGWLFRIDYEAFLRTKGVTPEQTVETLVTLIINGLRMGCPAEALIGQVDLSTAPLDKAPDAGADSDDRPQN